MRLTEEQIQAIIDDMVSKMEGVIEDPCNGDYSDFECYEDDYGRSYDFGSHCFESELEEICIDGLPGIPADDADIYITAKYSADVSFHDDYDPGDYWTPPSGGIEIDEVDASVYDIVIEIDVYNQDTDEYDAIEIPQEVIDRIEKSVNEKICATSKSSVA